MLFFIILHLLSFESSIVVTVLSAMLALVMTMPVAVSVLALAPPRPALL